MEYQSLAGKEFKLAKAVPIANWHRKACWVKSDLWCAAYDKGIMIYDKELKLKHAIKSEQIKYVECLALDPRGNVLVACSHNHGLHLVEADTGKYVRKITDGNFNYVCVNPLSYQVYAVENLLQLVFVLEKIRNTWIQTSVLRNCMTDSLDTIAVYKELLYVCSHKDRQLKLYSLDGTLVHETRQKGKEQLLFPRLCGVDRQGTALVCDWMNHKVHTYSVSGDQWNVLKFKDKLDYPVEVCKGLDTADLFVLQHGVSKVQPNKLIQFTTTNTTTAQK